MAKVNLGSYMVNYIIPQTIAQPSLALTFTKPVLILVI